MKRTEPDSTDEQMTPAQSLRNRAKEKLRADKKNAEEPLLSDSTRERLYELRILQAERELQNEELLQREEELKATRAKYLNFFNYAPVGYLSINADGLITEANLTASHILGIERSLIIKRPVTSFIVCEDQEIYDLFQKRLIETGLTQACEIRMSRTYGTRFWVRMEASTAMRAENEERSYNVVISDITERRHMDEFIQESENLLRESQEIAGLGSYVLDINSGLWRGSETLAKVFGIDEARERTVDEWSSMLHPDDRAITLCYFRNEVVGRGQPFDKEYRVIRQNDSSERWVHGLGRLAFDAQGHPMKMCGTIQDITDRKLAEIELRHAKEQAEASTKLKDQFVEMVAHDLRSPLASMMGMLKHFAERKRYFEDEECKKVFDLAFKSGDRMVGMIQELLKLSMLHTGKIKPQPRFFKGYQAAEDAIESLSHNASQKGIEIINDVPVDMRLYADQSLFGEVLLNLLSNAIKFCSRGDKITFFTPSELSSAIAVRDTGKGIDEKSLSNLFRHEVTTSTPGTAGELGTGLGLPYCNDIMQALGGKITVKSVSGNGSEFCAEIPYVKPLALVVEDDSLALTAISGHLKKIGLDVMEAMNGAQALAALKENSPHIVITDIMMPGMDGFELLDRLKRDSVTREIPVILITGADRAERENAFRRGADDFVGKPLQLEEFIPRVRRFVG